MPSPISKQTLSSFLRDSGIEPHCPAECYALPELDWITGEFTEAIQSRQNSDGMRHYKNGRNICHHYSRHASVVASLCHLWTPDTGEGESSLAFGWIDFDRPDGTGHSINLAVCRDESERLFLVYYEPQTRLLVSPAWKENTVPFAEI